MIAAGGRTFGWKRPECVGENRCRPCTLANLLVVAVATCDDRGARLFELRSPDER